MGKLLLFRRREVEPRQRPSDAELIRAVRSGTMWQVESLLIQGANPNAVDRFETALGYAVWKGKLGMSQILVRHGADVNQRNTYNYTPLHQLAWYGKSVAQKICSILLDNGADINASDAFERTPLMNAVDCRDVDLVKLLIERGADATIKNTTGKRAIDMVGSGTESESLRKLLKQVS